jgi:hypothetical protein
VFTLLDDGLAYVKEGARSSQPVAPKASRTCRGHGRGDHRVSEGAPASASSSKSNNSASCVTAAQRTHTHEAAARIHRAVAFNGPEHGIELRRNAYAVLPPVDRKRDTDDVAIGVTSGAPESPGLRSAASTSVRVVRPVRWVRARSGPADPCRQQRATARMTDNGSIESIVASPMPGGETADPQPGRASDRTQPPHRDGGRPRNRPR